MRRPPKIEMIDSKRVYIIECAFFYVLLIFGSFNTWVYLLYSIVEREDTIQSIFSIYTPNRLLKRVAVLWMRKLRNINKSNKQHIIHHTYMHVHVYWEHPDSAVRWLMQLSGGRQLLCGVWRTRCTHMYVIRLRDVTIYDDYVYDWVQYRTI